VVVERDKALQVPLYQAMQQSYETYDAADADATCGTRLGTGEI